MIKHKIPSIYKLDSLFLNICEKYTLITFPLDGGVYTVLVVQSELDRESLSLTGIENDNKSLSFYDQVKATIEENDTFIIDMADDGCSHTVKALEVCEEVMGHKSELSDYNLPDLKTSSNFEFSIKLARRNVWFYFRCNDRRIGWTNYFPLDKVIGSNTACVETARSPQPEDHKPISFDVVNETNNIVLTGLQAYPLFFLTVRGCNPLDVLNSLAIEENVDCLSR